LYTGNLSIIVSDQILLKHFLFRWEFESDDYDVAFGIERRGGEGDPLVAIERVDSHLTPEEGQIVCTEPGDCEYR